MQDIIKITNLHKAFKERSILSGINLSVKKGSSLVILGGSGSGKSVLIKTITGLLPADSGSIIIDNLETKNLSTKERKQIMQKCGFLFQGGALFDSLSIRDNIIFGVQDHTMSENEKNKLAENKLQSVGLPKHILNLYPSNLSGGMQKRVALARAICMNPKILFFDEPTTGLDPILANIINQLIIKLRRELGATTITITHDIESMKQIATDVAFIYQGKILWSGKKEEVENSNNEYLYQFIKGLTQGPINLNI